MTRVAMADERRHDTRHRRTSGFGLDRIDVPHPATSA
jgi:hypothetical protein